jgi:hypothetical protein
MCGDVANDEEELSPSSIAKKITVTKVRFIRSRDSLVEMVVGVGDYGNVIRTSAFHLLGVSLSCLRTRILTPTLANPPLQTRGNI